jgi:hypothetical protein
MADIQPAIGEAIASIGFIILQLPTSRKTAFRLEQTKTMLCCSREMARIRKDEAIEVAKRKAASEHVGVLVFEGGHVSEVG